MSTTIQYKGYICTGYERLEGTDSEKYLAEGKRTRIITESYQADDLNLPNKVPGLLTAPPEFWKGGPYQAFTVERLINDIICVKGPDVSICQAILLQVIDSEVIFNEDGPREGIMEVSDNALPSNSGKYTITLETLQTWTGVVRGVKK